jgi:hypothetical protein
LDRFANSVARIFPLLDEMPHFQLDFVGAILQSYAVDRTVTTLPNAWSELFPELSEWFGVPLLCLKSLYGGQYCNKSWDDHLSTWMTKYGLKRLESEGSIFMLRDGDRFLCLLNAVDDQLYMLTATNATTIRNRCKNDFDVDLIGQAHWYLQARTRSSPIIPLPWTNHDTPP